MDHKGIILILLFLITASPACKNEEPSEIFGTVSIYPDDAPLANAKIELSAQKIDQGSYNPNYQLIDETFTNQTGGFEFSFDPMMASYYRLDVYHDNCRKHRTEFPAQDFSTSKQISIQVVKQAQLNVHIRNQIGPSESDEFKIRIKNIPDICQDCSSPDYSYFYGPGIDTTIIFEVAGNDEVLIEYVTNKNDGEFNTQTKFCNPGIDNNLKIDY